MSNLFLRIVSALLLAPPLVALILWQRPEGVAVVVWIAIAISLHEWVTITLAHEPKWFHGVVVVCGVALSVVMYFYPAHFSSGLIALLLFLSVMKLLRPGELQTSAANLSLAMFGILYLALFLSPLALMKRDFPHGTGWVLLSLTLTWLTDSGAYFVGRAIGKHKLYPLISPGKSVEGAIGGLLFGWIAVVIAKVWYLPELSWLDTALIGIPASVLSQSGDLVESMIKRAYHVKDSGKLIPGHGGLLDRVDALLFCVPYVYLYVVLGR